MVESHFGADGNGDPGLKAMVSDPLGDIDARAVNSVVIGGDGDRAGILVRVGRYGTYLQRGEARANVPAQIAPDESTPERALELFQAPNEDRVLGADPDSGLPVIARAGRFGPYVQVGEADGTAKTKPKTASLLASMRLETVTLDDALNVLSLPRVVGTAADGSPVTAHYGRYGPYIKKGDDNRTLESEELLFTITLKQCERILAQPKRRRSQAAKGPLKELGRDPAADRPMVINEDRFGPYVTDGETNASLRTGDTVETITAERTAELLLPRRERGPALKRRSASGRSATIRRTTTSPWAAVHPRRVGCLDLSPRGNQGTQGPYGLEEPGGHRSLHADGLGRRQLHHAYQESGLLGLRQKNEQPPALFFNLPGLGRLMLTALNSRDYPVISGINLFFAAMVVVAINLVIDLI